MNDEMIFSLVQDFADTLAAAMPREHPRYRILTLLDDAIHPRDITSTTAPYDIVRRMRA